MAFRVLLPSGREKSFRGRWEGDGSPVGWRVLVPTSTGGTTGVVVGVCEDLGGEEEIISFPDNYPILTPLQLELLTELSEDYLLPKGWLLFKLLPSAFLWREEEFLVAPKGEVSGLDRLSREVLEYVRRRGGVKLENLKRRWGAELLRVLLQKGLLRREKRWLHPEVERSYYRLRVPLREGLLKVRSPKKRELLLLLSEMGWVSEEEVLSWGFRRSWIKDLLRRGLLELRSERETELPKEVKGVKILKSLSSERVLLWERLSVILEILLQEVLSLLEEGRSTLLLLPETSLLDPIRDLFGKSLGDRLREIHSGVPPRKVIENWLKASESPSLVVGSYLASLCPAKDLGLVVLLGESSPGVRLRPLGGLDLRRLSFRLAMRSSSRLIFATQAPTLSSWKLVKEGRMEIAVRPKDLPPVEVVRRDAGEILTEGVYREVKGNLGKSVLFLTAKQGWSYVYCRRCESVVQCPVCETFLTYSRESNTLYCTACSYRSKELSCPECEGELSELGFGIEKAMEVIERSFGTLENFHFATYPSWEGSYDLTVVLSADGILSVPSHRSEEELFTYLTKALLITKDKMLIQTMFPSAEVFSRFRERDIDGFYTQELRRREREALPPFWRLLLIKTRRKEVGGYAVRFLSSRVKTSFRAKEGVYEVLVHFKDRSTLKKVKQMVRKFGKDIIEVKVDPF